MDKFRFKKILMDTHFKFFLILYYVNTSFKEGNYCKWYYRTVYTHIYSKLDLAIKVSSHITPSFTQYYEHSFGP